MNSLSVSYMLDTCWSVLGQDTENPWYYSSTIIYMQLFHMWIDNLCQNTLLRGDALSPLLFPVSDLTALMPSCLRLTCQGSTYGRLPPPLLPAQDLVFGVQWNLGIQHPLRSLFCFTLWHLLKHRYPHKWTIPRRWKALQDNSFFHCLTNFDPCFTFHGLVSCCLRVLLLLF